MTEDIWTEKPNIIPEGYYYSASEMDVWLINLKAHYETIEKQAETLRLLFGDKGIKNENLMKIQVWQEKAEKLPIYVKQFQHMTDHALELEDKLESTRKWFHRLDTAVYKMSLSLPSKTSRYTYVSSKALRDTMLMRDRIKNILEAEG